MTGDVVVVVLELFEVTLVIANQLVDMQVLTFLHLMHLNFQLQLQLFLEAEQPLFEFLFGFDQFVLVVYMQHSLLGKVLLLQLLTAFDVFLLVLVVSLFEVMFDSLHDLDASMVVIVLFGLSALAISLDLLVGSLLFILQMPNFLQIYLNFHIMILLHCLCLRLSIEDLQLQLINFGFRVLVVLLDHITVHLDVVALGFQIVAAVFEQGKVLLEFCSAHLHELVVGFLLLLWLLGRHRWKLQIICIIRSFV